MVYTYSACMAGPYHLKQNIVCQDAFSIRSVCDGNMIIAAVADGLGSEKHSDKGSKAAAEDSVRYCAEHLDSDMDTSDDLILNVMREAFEFAYQSVGSKAATDGNRVDEYDTTLCLCVYNAGRKVLYYGQSGDSGIVALMENGQYLRITEQQRDSDGSVYPLCFESKWAFGTVVQPVSSVMLVTDGILEQICPSVLRNRPVEINIPLAAKFLDRNSCSLGEIAVIEEQVYIYLKNYPEDRLDDDKTIVALINSESIPARLEDSYYRKPDWDSILAENRSRLYGDSEFEQGGGQGS